MGDRSVQLMVTPAEYFRSKVEEAKVQLDIKLNAEVEFYVVNLLCDFITPQKISSDLGTENVLEVPLASLLQKAMESGSVDQKMRLLKSLGDISLYVSGYFQDYFNRKTFDIGYYIDLGSLAYQNVFSMLERREARSSAKSVYMELAQHFVKVVDVVAEVSGSATLAEDDAAQLLNVYDRWTRSNSDRLRKMLLKAGIVPIAVPNRLAQ